MAGCRPGDSAGAFLQGWHHALLGQSQGWVYRGWVYRGLLHATTSKLWQRETQYLREKTLFKVLSPCWMSTALCPTGAADTHQAQRGGCCSPQKDATAETELAKQFGTAYTPPGDCAPQEASPAADFTPRCRVGPGCHPALLALPPMPSVTCPSAAGQGRQAPLWSPSGEGR